MPPQKRRSLPKIPGRGIFPFQRLANAQVTPAQKSQQPRSPFQGPIQRQRSPNILGGLLNLFGGGTQQNRRGPHGPAQRNALGRENSDRRIKIITETAKSRAAGILLPPNEGLRKGTARNEQLRALAAGKGAPYQAFKRFLEHVEKDEKAWKALSVKKVMVAGRPSTLAEVKRKILESIADGSIGSFGEIQASLTAIDKELFDRKKYKKFVEELFSTKEIADMRIVFGEINKVSIAIPPQLASQPFDTNDERKARARTRARERARDSLTPNLARVNQRAAQQVQQQGQRKAA
jgi:hypothetical protein